MPGEMEYDIFAHADTEMCFSDSLGTSQEEKERGSDGYFSRLVYLLHSLFFSLSLSFSLSVFAGLDAPNATEPSQRMSVQLTAKSRRSHGGAGSLESPTVLSGFQPNVDLVLVCVHNCFVCTFLPFLSYLPLVISFCRAILRPSPLFALPKILTFSHDFSKKSAFEIHLQCLTQFLMPDFFFPAPI